MNNKYFVCCARCVEDIAKRSTGAARLWMDLCALETEKGIGCYQCHDHPHLRVLEIAGYLKSTDTGEGISIKLHGRIETEEGIPFFCSKGGNHD